MNTHPHPASPLSAEGTLPRRSAVIVSGRREPPVTARPPEPSNAAVRAMAARAPQSAGGDPWKPPRRYGAAASGTGRMRPLGRMRPVHASMRRECRMSRKGLKAPEGPARSAGSAALGSRAPRPGASPEREGHQRRKALPGRAGEGGCPERSEEATPPRRR